MSLHARLERRRRWTRLAQGLLSVVIVAHVLLGAASEARETTAGRAIYDLGRPALSSLARNDLDDPLAMRQWWQYTAAKSTFYF